MYVYSVVTTKFIPQIIRTFSHSYVNSTMRHCYLTSSFFVMMSFVQVGRARVLILFDKFRMKIFMGFKTKILRLSSGSVESVCCGFIMEMGCRSRIKKERYANYPDKYRC
jgi:hypothetical protein